MSLQDADGVDRRHAPRLKLTLELRLLSPGGALRAYSADISSTGLFAETVDLLPVGMEVEVELSLPDPPDCQPVQARGTVVRHVTVAECRSRGVPPGLGIRFDELTVGGESLEAFVEERLEQLREEPPAPRPVPLSSSRRGPPESAPRRERVTPPRRESRALPPETPAPPEPSAPEAPERSTRRFAVQVPLRWGEGKELTREALLFDLSSAGAFVETRRPAGPGALVRLWFELPLVGRPKVIDVAAKVSRVGAGDRGRSPGMGVVFKGPESELRNIHLFVTGRLQHEAALESALRRQQKDESLESAVPLDPAADPFKWGRVFQLVGRLGVFSVGLILLIFLLLLVLGASR